jgi:hypothetical protein
MGSEFQQRISSLFQQHQSCIEEQSEFLEGLRAQNFNISPFFNSCWYKFEYESTEVVAKVDPHEISCSCVRLRTDGPEEEICVHLLKLIHHYHDTFIHAALPTPATTPSRKRHVALCKPIIMPTSEATYRFAQNCMQNRFPNAKANKIKDVLKFIDRNQVTLQCNDVGHTISRSTIPSGNFPNVYSVSVTYNGQQDRITSHCSCPSFEARGFRGPCKHAEALHAMVRWEIQEEVPVVSIIPVIHVVLDKPEHDHNGETSGSP